MNRDVRRFRPSWRADARALRPELWLVALAAVAMLLTEVWQSSAMTEQSMALDAGKRALTQVQDRLAWTQAKLDRQTTRRELARARRVSSGRRSCADEHANAPRQRVQSRARQAHAQARAAPGRRDGDLR